MGRMAATLTIRDVAVLLAVSERTVLRWIDSGDLTATDLSAGGVYNRWRIDPDDLGTFLRKRRSAAGIPDDAA